MCAFRGLALAEPFVVELREWPRMTDDLNAERNRLCNRLRDPAPDAGGAVDM